jgi:hypothetical protein
MSDDPRKRYRRDTGYSWIYCDGRHDYGSVIREGGQLVATTVRGSARFDVVGDAKDFVERHSS